MTETDNQWPTFFVAGAAKSGTSSLHAYLAQHANVFMTEVKEPHYFAFDDRYLHGRAWYRSLFSQGMRATARGESSTGYMVFPRVPERIQRDVHDPRFIFVLRNPVDRCYSHYRWMMGLGLESRSYEDAFLSDRSAEPDPQRGHFGNFKFYCQYGLYGKWVARYLATFRRDRLCIVTAESLRRSPLDAVNLCFQFLGVDELPAIASTEKNRTGRLLCPPIYWSLVWFFGYSKFPRLLHRISAKRFSRACDRALRWLYEARDTRFQRDVAYPPITREQRGWTAQFYSEDVSHLRSLTGQPFVEWISDFPS